MRAIVPVTRGGIMKLSDQEIFHAIQKICEQLYTHVRMPAAIILNCENLIHSFMILLYDDYMRKFFDQQAKDYVGFTLETIMKRILRS